MKAPSLKASPGYHWLYVFLLPAFFSCKSLPAFKAFEPSPEILHRIDSVCMKQLREENYPGLCISVITPDGKQWSKGYGYANLEMKQPIQPSSHLFRIGSISKTVTAVAMAKLVEKGQINLDTPIVTYIFSIPADKRNITLRQLGGHQGGIRHYKGFEFLSNVHYTKVWDAMEVFIHDTLLFEPGTKYNYTTYGWTVISAGMEGAAIKPILNIIRDEISGPMRIPDLKGDHVDSIHFNRVGFYEFQNGKHVDSPTADLSNKWSGGGLLCSGEDLARFGYYLTGPGYLKGATLTEFTSPQELSDGSKTNYGIGFRSGEDEDGNLWYGHSGGSVGGTSMLLIYPDLDLVVVTLVNQGGATMNDLAWTIAEIVRKTAE